MTLHLLSAFNGLTVLDVATTDIETKFFLMSVKDVKFSDLFNIKEQLQNVKDIIIYTWDSQKSPNGEQCQMEIIVKNKERMESVHPPRNSDSIKTANKRSLR